ncbi:hypothetical protein I862_01350 [endosymbiont of Acanthamoeba sp. UWC8]|uniref:hypothetical protein n=1 Tax=endosymbiont of Acanthamoeba sp. UWC8 TaxID=86106 RepID=UPI0004D0F12D|nr:hypothetical protein [endosymbiont of Acanthamoeba sp. UWC8]AIF80833.1 hypothetical protein I862_01350 [endosymbiont of Acanthamoeba sp. UWC8]
MQERGVADKQGSISKFGSKHLTSAEMEVLRQAYLKIEGKQVGHATQIASDNPCNADPKIKSHYTMDNILNILNPYLGLYKARIIAELSEKEQKAEKKAIKDLNKKNEHLQNQNKFLLGEIYNMKKTIKCAQEMVNEAREAVEAMKELNCRLKEENIGLADSNILLTQEVGWLKAKIASLEEVYHQPSFILDDESLMQIYSEQQTSTQLTTINPEHLHKDSEAVESINEQDDQFRFPGSPEISQGFWQDLVSGRESPSRYF